MRGRERERQHQEAASREEKVFEGGAQEGSKAKEKAEDKAERVHKLNCQARQMESAGNSETQRARPRGWE